MEQGHDDMPHPSPARTEKGHDEMPHPSQQAQLIHEQRVPFEEGHAKEDEDLPEWELRNKHPVCVSPLYVPMKDVTFAS
jgi:hypothetical protein